MPDKWKKLFFLVILFLLLLFPQEINLLADDLVIKFNNPSINSSRLVTDIDIKGWISYGTIDAIKNGITARMYIIFQVLYKGPLSMGRHITGERTIVFTISYDVWENKFLIVKKGDSDKYPVKNASEILPKIASLTNPVEIQIQRKSDEIISLRAKIKIQTLKLYPPLGLFLFFYDPWNYESRWYYSTNIKR